MFVPPTIGILVMWSVRFFSSSLWWQALLSFMSYDADSVVFVLRAATFTALGKPGDPADRTLALDAVPQREFGFGFRHSGCARRRNASAELCRPGGAAVSPPGRLRRSALIIANATGWGTI